MPARIVSSKQVYSGKLLILELLQVEGPDGRTREREVVRHPGAVVIVPLLEEDGGQRVILVRQYRAPLDRELLEVPAGTLEPGESPLECAERELSEETGYRARRWEKIAECYSTPGFCDERLTLFLARELEPLGGNHPDEGEFLQIEKIPLEELKRMLKEGELEDAKTLIGLLALFAP
ncbi:MAG: NUDIX hydrolase [Candidatus Bipolaricaulia bacterium]